MTDNINVTPGSGVVIATDDVAGVQYQRVKPSWGVDGSAVDVSATNPMPVQLLGGIDKGAGSTTSSTQRVTIAADSAGIFSADNYEVVDASATAQVLGSTGSSTDFLVGLQIIPLTSSPGPVDLIDGSVTTRVFVGGASSVASLFGCPLYLGIRAKVGPFKITTGANVRVIAIGSFV